VVAGTYVDEFAEHHLKEMCVREAIHGVIPSAGVGSAFDRRAFGEIARASDQQPFNPDSLTEDYEIGLKFRLARRRVHFACYTVAEQDGPAARRLERAATPRREQPIATREYFPKALRASVRQRSRWILGITLQTWEQIGWRGSLPVLYCLWRDRKALFTNSALVLSYGLLFYIIARTALATPDQPWNAAMLIPPESSRPPSR
jgi:bacteriophage N4 adsorption protein B